MKESIDQPSLPEGKAGSLVCHIVTTSNSSATNWRRNPRTHFQQFHEWHLKETTTSQAIDLGGISKPL